MFLSLPVEAPASIRLERGGLSGTLLVRLAALKGAASYEVHVAVGDPAVEVNWKPVLISANVRGLALKDLTAGTVYYMRVRGIGGRGPGPWTVSSGVMAA
jgi:hypothetical protein